jgi:hypothetical protein
MRIKLKHTGRRATGRHELSMTIHFAVEEIQFANIKIFLHENFLHKNDPVRYALHVAARATCHAFETRDTSADR